MGGWVSAVSISLHLVTLFHVLVGIYRVGKVFVYEPPPGIRANLLRKLGGVTDDASAKLGV